MKRDVLIELLMTFSEIQFTEECINILKGSGYAFKEYKEPFDRNRQLEILSKRFKDYKSDKVEGAKDLLIRLIKSESEFVRMLKIAVDQGTYSIYISDDFKTISGILFNRTINQDKYLSLEKEYKKRGLKNLTNWERH